MSLVKSNPDNSLNNESYLTELLWHHARNNVEAINHEINEISLLPQTPENEARLFRYLEMEKEAQRQAYNLSLQLN